MVGVLFQSFIAALAVTGWEEKAFRFAEHSMVIVFTLTMISWIMIALAMWVIRRR
jgi:hypothetical protein